MIILHIKVITFICKIINGKRSIKKCRIINLKKLTKVITNATISLIECRRWIRCELSKNI